MLQDTWSTTRLMVYDFRNTAANCLRRASGPTLKADTAKATPHAPNMAAIVRALIPVLVLMSGCDGLSHLFRKFYRDPTVQADVKLPKEQYFTQTLDHFNYANTNTWQQRYFVNTTFYKSGGPLFVMIGGEGTADPIWMVEGQWIRMAEVLNAACVMLEHRFYGKSHPTSDMSVANLRYLSSEQALADLANFIPAIKEPIKVAPNAKVITFGGSYPGSLSAWFRLKYPHLVDGAVSTSAPLQALIDFDEYLGVVTQSLATSKVGGMCNKAISQAVSQIATEMETDSGRALLSKRFKLCTPLNANTKDITNFYSTLAGNFEGVVQYNKDNRAFEGARATNITIDTVCDMMANSASTPMVNYANVNDLLLRAYSQNCTDYNYADFIKAMRATDWNSSAAVGGRQWTYQTCTEFGFFQSSDLPSQPFGHFFPVKFSIDQCTDIFGPEFNVTMLTTGVKKTNNNYGGKNIRITKVIFANGSIDPWHALGITSSENASNATAVYISGCAHCSNMYPSRPDDPPQLVAARKQIFQAIYSWL